MVINNVKLTYTDLNKKLRKYQIFIITDKH